uniref:Uncharacterized protein n=2 Tax=Physcomitrium patens TaxID=3218 RepID=A0A2K1KX50_PHYPA|nr:hypothetical protein PHYPA_005359 [Physcomitrium patens]
MKSAMKARAARTRGSECKTSKHDHTQARGRCVFLFLFFSRKEVALFTTLMSTYCVSLSTFYVNVVVYLCCCGRQGNSVCTSDCEVYL